MTVRNAPRLASVPVITGIPAGERRRNQSATFSRRQAMSTSKADVTSNSSHSHGIIGTIVNQNPAVNNENYFMVRPDLRIAVRL